MKFVTKTQYIRTDLEDNKNGFIQDSISQDMIAVKCKIVKSSLSYSMASMKMFVFQDDDGKLYSDGHQFFQKTEPNKLTFSQLEGGKYYSYNSAGCNYFCKFIDAFGEMMLLNKYGYSISACGMTDVEFIELEESK